MIFSLDVSEVIRNLSYVPVSIVSEVARSMYQTRSVARYEHQDMIDLTVVYT